ncbi:MAG: hypothetical protein OXG44_06040 [Gammaproteobacteria bacterium]|nr:hypothetical protein [Gammaproteobacteria bacterium]
MKYNWRQIWMIGRFCLYEYRCQYGDPAELSTAQLAAMIRGRAQSGFGIDVLPTLPNLVSYLARRAKDGRVPDDIRARQPEADERGFGDHCRWSVRLAGNG